MMDERRNATDRLSHWLVVDFCGMDLDLQQYYVLHNITVFLLVGNK